MDKVLKVYISTPLMGDKFNLKKITEVLLVSPLVFAFIPPVGQLSDKDNGALLDKNAILLCDEVWVFGKIGRDCSWEIGFARGLGKPVKLFMTKEEIEYIQEDWMTFLDVTIVTLDE